MLNKNKNEYWKYGTQSNNYPSGIQINNNNGPEEYPGDCSLDSI
jgi:hypothetical protein